MQPVQRLFEFFEPSHYDVRLELQREQRVFSGTVTIRGRKTTDDRPFMLHAKDLVITSVLVEDTAVPYTLDGDECTVSGTFPAGDYTLQAVFSGRITDAMHGIYPCYYEHDGQKKELLATQFESHHAREAFPCIDEPEAKATFDLTLVTEASVAVLSNKPARSSQTTKGRQVTSFFTTPRMSTYLLAFVTGELHHVAARTTTGIDVRVWATPVHASTSLQFALDTTVRSLEFYDDYFGTPYPLPKCDLVAVPDFSVGAMENWGLITFREVCLLAAQNASLTTKQYVAKVVTHELAHQWFGNLVTMRWWNDLWLNESFASLMEFVSADRLFPDWNIYLTMPQRAAAPALRRDATDGIQAVQCEVRHPDEINALFDPAIVYTKGCRLLYMLEQYLSPEVFQQGLQLYFKQHAYRNTVASDLWRAMSAVSGQDIETFMHPWLTQPGYPVVGIEANMIKQTQFFIGNHSPSSRRWSIPLFTDPAAIPRLFEQTSQHISIPLGTVLNAGGRAHMVAHYNPRHLKSLLSRLADGSLATIDRLTLLHNQYLLAEAETIPAASLVPLLSAFSHETEEPVWSMVIMTAQSLARFVEHDPEAWGKLQAFFLQLVEAPFARLGWVAQAHEPESDMKLRADILDLVVQSGNKKALAPALDLYQSSPPDAFDPTTRSAVLKAVLVQRPEEFATLWNKYHATTAPELRSHLLEALSSATRPADVRVMLRALTDNTLTKPQDVKLWIGQLLHTPENRKVTWRWMQDNWSWVERTFRTDMTYDRLVTLAGNSLATIAEQHEFDAFFADKQDQVEIARAIHLASAQIAARVRLLQHQSPRVILAIEER